MTALLKHLIVLRGCSGSGKSTFARREFPSALILSADDHLMKNGVYVYDTKQVGVGHLICQRKFEKALTTDVPLIVIDNTNIKVGEIKPYVTLAKEHGCAVEILTIHCDPKIAFERNVHGVPQETILEMCAALKRSGAAIPTAWNHYEIPDSSTPFKDRKWVVHGWWS